MIKISPSILAANFASLGNEIKALEAAGADMIHIDVMDGHFVPNLTIGPQVIKSLRSYTKLPFDVHLMIEKPELWVEDYVHAGADMLTIHPEATIHLDRLINKIKSCGIKAGIALLPTTSEHILQYILDQIDLILVMTVNPGFGGQHFIPEQLNKINNLSKIINERCIKLDIAVDGGMNENIARQVISAGANILVAGSFIFNHTDYALAISNLRAGNK